MSWLVGALQTAGSLVDMAGTISGIVYQQRQAAQLERQNKLMEDWMNKQEALQHEQMQLSKYLAIEGPTARVQAAIDSGFDPVSARRLAGSQERVIYGNLDRPIMQATAIEGIRTTKHLESMNLALSTFKKGTPFGKPAPPRITTGRPGGNNPSINLGHNPGTSQV
ncbi:minor structural protein [Sapovirus Hu/D1714-B/2008/JPN]|nr:minor structural protein [Sapovirus Hu/D1714-B/2008/JPN]